jgi:hypothetical protein
MPHRAHWQPLSYNALHGGMQRWFEPMQAEVLAQPAWQALMQWLGSVATQAQGGATWFTEAHQFQLTPPTALVGLRPKGHTVTAWTGWRCF